MFEWYVVSFESKNDIKNVMCLKDIGLHAKKMLTILGSKVNMIRKHLRPLNEYVNIQSYYSPL